MEILYEPDVPWFKIIAPAAHQAEVRLYFETCLENMLELESGLVRQDFDDDLEDDFDDEAEDFDPRADVKIVVSDAHIIPWVLHQDKIHTDTTDYDNHRFPELLSKLRYKRVWRGLESIDGLTLTKLLSKYNFLWGYGDATIGLEKLSEASRCQITHNMCGTLVYVGSDKHANSPESAIRKLRNLFDFQV